MLRYGVAARAFAHADLLGVATNQLAHAVAHQVVIENHIGVLQHLQTAQGQQASIAWPGAHQNDLPASAAGVIEFVFKKLLRCRLITGLHQAGKATTKYPFPEATAFRHAGQAGFQMVAPVAGLLGHPAQACRQQRFDFFPQDARQHRGGAAGGDRHQQRRAVNNRRKNKGAERLVIHHVHQTVTDVGGIGDALVERPVFGGGNHQHHIVDLRFSKVRFGNNLHARACPM